MSTILSPESKILVIGAGSSSKLINSGLSEEMYEDGFTNITNVDFSPSVVAAMVEKLKEKDPPI